MADDECECGPVHWELSDQERIVGGGEAPEHEYPWQISLFVNTTEPIRKLLEFVEKNKTNLPPEVNEMGKSYSGATHMCGGSIISPKFIFTAAHCFGPWVMKGVTEDIADELPKDLKTYTHKDEDFLVVVGAHELPYKNKITSKEQVENNQNIHRVREIMKHQKYDYRKADPIYMDYDFAILKLESILRFSAKIAPVCLPDPRFSASKYAGQIGVVSGWGMTDIDSTITSPVLKDLRVRIFSNCLFEECLEIKKDFFERRERKDGGSVAEAKMARSKARVPR